MKRTDTRIFVLSAIAMSVAVWQVTFNFGVYHTVFYEHVFTIWVASGVALIASFFIAPIKDKEVRMSWRGRFVLAAPTAWILVSLSVERSIEAALSNDILLALGLLVGLVSLPYTLYVVVLVVTPDLVQLESRKLKLGLVAIVLTVALLGFLVGRFNDYFLTCNDFLISGNAAPDRCGLSIEPVLDG